MSGARLADAGAEEKSGSSAETHAAELEWPENPYQAMADAQVFAGAWPGTPLLLEAAVSYPGPAVQQGQEEIEEHVEDLPAACPWDFLFEFSAPDKRISGYGSSSLDSMDEIDTCEPQDCSSDAFDGTSSLAPCTEGESSSSRGGWKLSHRCVPRATDFLARYGRPLQQPLHRPLQQPLSRQPQGGVSGARSSSSSCPQPCSAETGEATTLMIRHIPNVYTRSMMVEELEALGLDGLYDFLYLPIDKSTQWNVGYAFVNFVNPAAASMCVAAMTDYVFRCFEHNSGKVTQVSIAHIQGLVRNLEYYSNTAVQCAGSHTTRPLVLNARPKEGSGRGPRRRRRQRPNRTRLPADDSAEEGLEGAAGAAGAAEEHTRTL